MKKVMWRSLLVAFVLCLSLLPTAALADETTAPLHGRPAYLVLRHPELHEVRRAASGSGFVGSQQCGRTLHRCKKCL